MQGHSCFIFFHMPFFFSETFFSPIQQRSNRHMSSSSSKSPFAKLQDLGLSARMDSGDPFLLMSHRLGHRSCTHPPGHKTQPHHLPFSPSSAVFTFFLGLQTPTPHRHPGSTSHRLPLLIIHCSLSGLRREQASELPVLTVYLCPHVLVPYGRRQVT